MKPLGANEIREKYLHFFETKDHLRLPSFSLVPKNDPSILLINAGMTPMKSWFSGAEKPPHPRVTTCQRCIRTPDIENVGYSERHGTFFEMLGNFSFGDYFKKEAINWAWEFLTQWLELDPERLSVTVFKDDDEAYGYWHDDVGLPESKIFRYGKEDNFWEHGTGPCGPCSEIFFDRGVAHGCGKPDCAPGCDCDRFVEIWNLVFTQFDRQEDGSYIPLSQKNIDTGAGLERMATVMQEVNNLFEIDTVKPILQRVSDLADQGYGESKEADVAIRVITDHTRSATMMLADGIVPSNSGAGYVLRRLVRRAARFGRLLGIEKNFLPELAEIVIEQSGGAYPELLEHREFILMNIAAEEEKFGQTLSQGSQFLDEAIAELRQKGESQLSGEVAFKLHDTFGFPYDLTSEIAKEEGISMDPEGFEAAMAEQKRRAREAQLAKAGSAWTSETLPEGVSHEATRFIGYDHLRGESTLRQIIVQDDEGMRLVDAITADDPHESLLLIFDETPFYAESGGQVADRGWIRTGSGELECELIDCQKNRENVFLHRVVLHDGRLQTGTNYQLEVDAENRMAIARNHTSTHLLHKALREVLGAHVTQAGSYVDAKRLRFDFHHPKAMSREEIDAVEAMVNEAILAAYPVSTEIMSVEEAKAKGAMALFEEKYGEHMRVLSIGDFSMELCGGTHLKNSVEAAYFRVVSEQSVASGIRRVEAVTGHEAMALADREKLELRGLSDALKTPAPELLTRVVSLQDEIRELERELKRFESMEQDKQAAELLGQAEDLGDFKLLLHQLEGVEMEALRTMAESIRDQLAPAVVLLGSNNDGKAQFVCAVSKSLNSQGFKAGELVKIAAQMTGGGGGGRPDMAQAGGKDVTKLPEALAAVKDMVHEKVKEA